jgi:hypothetical protein
LIVISRDDLNQELKNREMNCKTPIIISFNNGIVFEIIFKKTNEKGNIISAAVIDS